MEFKPHRDPEKGKFVIYPNLDIAEMTNKDTGRKIVLYKLQEGLVAMIDDHEYIIPWWQFCELAEEAHEKHVSEVA